MKNLKRHAVSYLLSPGSLFLLVLLACGMAITGCSQQSAKTKPASDSADNGSASRYLLKSEPDGASGVIRVREAAKDQDNVVIVGRIGGSEMPWIEGRAAFSIVDPSIKSCLECGADGCPKPWDYC